MSQSVDITKHQSCPFCGSTRTTTYKSTTAAKGKEFTVGCAECGTHGPRANSAENSVMLWNARVTYKISEDGRSIKCFRCSMTSHHPEDVKRKYCGKCHEYHDATITLHMCGPGTHVCDTDGPVVYILGGGGVTSDKAKAEEWGANGSTATCSKCGVTAMDNDLMRLP